MFSLLHVQGNILYASINLYASGFLYIYLKAPMGKIKFKIAFCELRAKKFYVEYFVNRTDFFNKK
jgi:hypothetical protein